MDALAFLASKAPIGPLYVLHGDEGFLKRQVLLAIRSRALGEDATEQDVSTQAGEGATFADIFDELQTAPFFTSRRVVVVHEADPFVSRFRAQLEKHINDLPATGVLVLDVKTWPANTRLAKMVSASATIVCKAPPPYKLPQWCVEWAATQYQKQLATPAASLLVDLVGGDMGLLDQELVKLSIYVGERKKIETSDVDTLVGNSRSESTWKIFDAVAEGRMAEALRLLDRQFEQGEAPMMVLGAFNMQLRRLAQAARLAIQGTPLRGALAQVGVPPFAVENAAKQLSRIGRERAARLYDRLLEVNLGFRGGNPLPERTQLERFLLRMAGEKK